MSKRVLSDEAKAKIDIFLSELHLNVQSAPGTGKTPLTEEYLVKLVTRFAVSLCTAFWSIRELITYISTRKTFAEIKSKMSS